MPVIVLNAEELGGLFIGRVFFCCCCIEYVVAAACVIVNKRINGWWQFGCQKGQVKILTFKRTM